MHRCYLTCRAPLKSMLLLLLLLLLYVFVYAGVPRGRCGVGLCLGRHQCVTDCTR